MPAWAVTLLVRFVLPLIIQWAVKHNLIGKVTACLATFGLSLKIEEKYPLDPPATLTPNNLAAQKVK